LEVGVLVAAGAAAAETAPASPLLEITFPLGVTALPLLKASKSLGEISAALTLPAADRWELLVESISKCFSSGSPKLLSSFLLRESSLSTCSGMVLLENLYNAASLGDGVPTSTDTDSEGDPILTAGASAFGEPLC